MNIMADNHFDAIERLIFEQGIRIEALDFHPELDLMIVVLNTKAVLKFPLSRHERLQSGTKQQLADYTLIGKGVGVHWEFLDEDLSLKSMLRDVLVQAIGSDNSFAKAS